MPRKYTVTGLMSGSSMDGVDLACCEFEWNGRHWDYRILAANTFPYSRELRLKLEQASRWSRPRIDELDLELGDYFAGLINDFHQNIMRRPDYIASHGHTILHEPHRGITLQAGNGRIMANRTGITVINDFRSEDVAQGGQGAPLVPLGDKLLFPRYEACLNLGGFANISCDNARGERVAYDLCPANMALNWVAGLEGKALDRNGEMARKGVVDPGLLADLNRLDFYQSLPPKSLGREWFLECFLPVIQVSSLTANDLMATVLEHIALQISAAVNATGVHSLLITGGGALNQTLIDRLKHHISASLVIPDKQLIHFKEALIFALLGLLRIRGEINCLSSATGGRKDISAGTVHEI